MIITDEARQTERAKYKKAYSNRNYRMSERRRLDACANLKSMRTKGPYLDVSCGQGDMIKQAKLMGFNPVHGTEIVDQLCDGITVVKGWCHALPFGDKSFDVVTMFDVIEHLIPGDDEAACREMLRVARKHIMISANNMPSVKAIGVDLHINKRPYDEWESLFRKWFKPGVVTSLPRVHDVGPKASPLWRVDL
jgi:ubiquinone/menaquinone biosynthesis C-methylase UbiE